MQTLNTWSQPRYYRYDQKRRPAAKARWLLLYLVLLAVVPAGVYYGSPQILQYGADSGKVVVNSLGNLSPQPAQAEALPPAPKTDYKALDKSVNQWIQSQKYGEWAVVVQDLDNPRNRVEVNAERTYKAASIYKLFLTIPLSEKLPFETWQKQRTPTSKSKSTVADCVRIMIAKSDNPCAVAIGGQVDWQKADQSVKAAGFKRTKLALATPTTTAGDTAKFLAGLQGGKWFDEPTRNFLLGSLSAQKMRTAIPAGCADCIVLNKTGSIEDVTHDSAIVTSASGNSRYVLVVFSRGGSYRQIADLSKLISDQIL